MQQTCISQIYLSPSPMSIPCSSDVACLEGPSTCLFPSIDPSPFACLRQVPHIEAMRFRAISTATSTLLALLLTPHAPAQTVPVQPDDPCGLPDTSTAAYRIAAISNWGYGFDSLRTDIARWSASPYVHVDSIGKSVQGRTLYELTIQDTAATSTPRKRVWIHARTHPSEVQGTWVTNEVIRILLSGSPTAKLLRAGCVFNIVPMFNPDGVELARARENANNVDIESNWNTTPGEPEVQALRARFAALMVTPNPIRVALNIHSSTSCTRYFVYHAATGTSAAYATTEQSFIGFSRSHFPGGFQSYDYFVSWAGTAPLVYPESWFWYNHREAVLALTYEDKNCATAGGFDSTASAIVLAIADQLGLSGPAYVAAENRLPRAVRLLQNYPNPFNPITKIQFTIVDRQLTIVNVYDLMGREVARLVNEVKEPGTYTVHFDGSGLASGVYLARLSANGGTQTIPILLVR